MEWKDVSKAVGKVAAGVAPLLTGPLGIAVSVGSLIADALGTEDSPEAVKRAIQSDPEAALKLQKMQLEHQAFLEQARIQQAEIDSKIEQARLADLQHARKLNNGHFMPPLLTVLLFFAVMGILYTLMNYQVPESAKEVVYMLAGSMSAAFTQAFSYWLGSSRGSAEKQAIMAKNGGKT